jgi:hypothetical protein
MNQGIGIPVLIIAPMLAAVMVVWFLLGTLAYKKALNTSRGNAALIFLFCIALSAASMLYRDSQHARFPEGPFGSELVWVDLAAGLLPFFAVPFLIRLYQRWIGGRLSDAEKATGMDGIRAWLSGGSLVCALLISVLACFGYSYSFWGVLALTIMALLAYPILNMASISFQPPPVKTDVASPERERVLRMLDEGKITAEETAELLNALGHSEQPLRPTVSTAASPHRKMVLTGLVLLLIGFFLPWFSIDLSPGYQSSRTLPSIREKMEEISRQNPGVPIPWPSSLHCSAGDLNYGLGWFILLLGVAAAALPYVADHLASEAQHKARLILLGLGSIILIFVLTDSLRFASIGILLGLAGYALQWVGLLKERQVAA